MRIKYMRIIVEENVINMNYEDANVIHTNHCICECNTYESL